MYKNLQHSITDGLTPQDSPFLKVRHLYISPHSIRGLKKIPACYKGVILTISGKNL